MTEKRVISGLTQLTDARGNVFRLVRPAGKRDAQGVADRALWRSVPDDGLEYLQDLGSEMGLVSVPEFTAVQK